MFWERVVVRDQERVLIAKNSRFDRILLPGEYCIHVAPCSSLSVETHDVRNVVFESVWADYLVAKRPELARKYFTIVKTTEEQVGMVYLNGELFTVLVPSKTLLFWRGQASVTAEIVDVVAEPELPVDLIGSSREQVGQAH